MIRFPVQPAEAKRKLLTLGDGSQRRAIAFLFTYHQARSA